MNKAVAQYQGIKIVKSCGYYYPEVNGNVECKSIQDVKEWLQNIWLPVQKNINRMEQKMGMSKNLVFNFFFK